MKRTALFAVCAGVVAALWAGSALASDPKPALGSEPAFHRALARATAGQQVQLYSGTGNWIFGNFVDYNRNELVITATCTGAVCHMTVPLDKIIALTIVERR